MPDALGVQFRGAAEPVVVRGRQVAAALQHLLPALDGTRTVEDLAALCPPEVPHEAVTRILDLLESRGLLEDGVEEPAPQADPVLGRQLLFFGRKLGLLHHVPSAAEAQRRLGSARVLLVATGAFGAATLDLLSRSGCVPAQVIAWNDDGLIAESLEGDARMPRRLREIPTTSIDAVAHALRGFAGEADLVVTATRNAPEALPRALNRFCLDRDRPFLAANEHAEGFDIGPYVRPFDSPCYTCKELREASTHEHAIEEQLHEQHLAAERLAGKSRPFGELLAAATLGASLVMLEVTRILTGISPPVLLGAVLRASPLAGTFRLNRILRVPRCPDCHRGAGAPRPSDA
jgi:bacteriocin biosynthesis cyclodehydratase domain-containing protein